MERSSPRKALALVISLALSLPVLYYCARYLLQDREILLQQYFKDSPCFYHSALFAGSFFTQAVKDAGNIYCALTIPLSICAALVVYRWWRQQQWMSLRLPGRSDCIYLLLLAGICTGLGAWGMRGADLCTDEAFSAINFAAAPVSRLLSYYPMPNNHIGFNFFNHWAQYITGDVVLSGRLLSLGCYILLIAGNFLFLRHLLANRLLAFAFCVVLALQFLVWGFGYQARGYALCYLMQWLAFIAVLGYFHRPAYRSYWLLLLVIANAIGMWTLASYMYWLLWQPVFGLYYTLRKRNGFPSFWLGYLLSLICIWLLYLPVTCYSGISAVSGNKYVSARPEYLHDLYMLGKGLTRLLGQGESLVAIVTGCVLLLLPLLLLLVRRSFRSDLLTVYVAMWCSLLLFLLVKRQIPFTRSLGGYLHISLLLALLSVYYGIARVARKGRTLMNVILVPALVIWAGFAIPYNVSHAGTDLYGQNTQQLMQTLNTVAQQVPSAGAVWCSAESFMMPFVLKRHHSGQQISYACDFRYQPVVIISNDDGQLPVPDFDVRYKAAFRQGDYTVYQIINY